MRLDKFLFCIRLLKSRTLAQALIAEGRIRINGQRVEKTAADVRAGDAITLPLRGSVRVIRVLRLPERRGPAAEAQGCYAEE